MRAFGFLAVVAACGVPSIDDYCKANPSACPARTWIEESDVVAQGLVVCAHHDPLELLDLIVCQAGTKQLGIALEVGRIDASWRYLYGADGRLFEIDHFGTGRDGVRADDDPASDTPEVGDCTAVAGDNVTLAACVAP